MEVPRLRARRSSHSTTSEGNCRTWMDIGLLLIKQRRTQIPFAKAAHDRDDQLPLILRPGGDFGGGGEVAAAADPAEDSFLLRQAPRPLERFVVGNLNDLVHDVRVQVFG